jgi:hypothetical protein
MVDSDSIRDLERHDFNIYIWARRISWGWNFRLCETKNPTGDEKYLCKYYQIFSRLCSELESEKEKIECLGEYFYNLGISNFSLDFLFNGVSNQIIDWDTDNDLRVLNSVDDISLTTMWDLQK